MRARRYHSTCIAYCMTFSCGNDCFHNLVTRVFPPIFEPLRARFPPNGELYDIIRFGRVIRCADMLGRITAHTAARRAGPKI